MHIHSLYAVVSFPKKEDYGEVKLKVMLTTVSYNSCIVLYLAVCTKVLSIGELIYLQKMAMPAQTQAPPSRRQLELCDHYTQQTALYHTEVF